MINNKTTLKTYFKNGDKPTELEFSFLIDSSISGLVKNLVYSNPLITYLSQGYIFTVTMTGDMEISNPIGGIDGNFYTWRIKQDNTGGHTVNLGSKFKLPSSAGSTLSWSIAPNAMDILVAHYDEIEDLFYLLSLRKP